MELRRWKVLLESPRYSWAVADGRVDHLFLDWKPVRVSLTNQRYHDRPVRCFLLSQFDFPPTTWRQQDTDSSWALRFLKEEQSEFLEVEFLDSFWSFSSIVSKEFATLTNSGQIELMRRTLALCGGRVAPAWTGIVSPSTSALAESPTLLSERVSLCTTRVLQVPVSLSVVHRLHAEVQLHA